MKDFRMNTNSPKNRIKERNKEVERNTQREREKQRKNWKNLKSSCTYFKVKKITNNKKMNIETTTTSKFLFS